MNWAGNFVFAGPGQFQNRFRQVQSAGKSSNPLESAWVFSFIFNELSGSGGLSGSSGYIAN
jgi:hypothetical protein